MHILDCKCFSFLKEPYFVLVHCLRVHLKILGLFPGTVNWMWQNQYSVSWSTSGHPIVFPRIQTPWQSKKRFHLTGNSG